MLGYQYIRKTHSLPSLGGHRENNLKVEVTNVLRIIEEMMIMQTTLAGTTMRARFELNHWEFAG